MPNMTIKINNSLERAVKEILSEYEEAQINLASDFSQTLLAKKICSKIRQRYHVFRINELLVTKGKENDDTRL
jgi:hypothetical protein